MTSENNAKQVKLSSTKVALNGTNNPGTGRSLIVFMFALALIYQSACTCTCTRISYGLIGLDDHSP